MHYFRQSKTKTAVAQYSSSNVTDQDARTLFIESFQPNARGLRERERERQSERERERERKRERERERERERAQLGFSFQATRAAEIRALMCLRG